MCFLSLLTLCLFKHPHESKIALPCSHHDIAHCIAHTRKTRSGIVAYSTDNWSQRSEVSGNAEIVLFSFLLGMRTLRVVLHLWRMESWTCLGIMASYKAAFFATSSTSVLWVQFKLSSMKYYVIFD